MTERELLILTAATFHASGQSKGTSLTTADMFIGWMDSELAKRGVIGSPDVGRAGETLLAEIPLQGVPGETSDPDPDKVPVETETAPQAQETAPAAAPKKKGRSVKVTENPLTAPKDQIISPPLEKPEPVPPTPPPLSSATVKPKDPANMPVGKPAFTERDTDIYSCSECSQDRIRVRIPRDGTNARAVCLNCGFVEEFEISVEDIALLRDEPVAEGTPAAKKAQTAGPAKPKAPQSEISVDKRTGEKTQITRWTDADGEPHTELKKLPPDECASQPETNQTTMPTPPVTPPIINGNSVPPKTASQNAPPPCSPRISDLVKEIAGYEPPPVNLEQARSEMTAIVTAWPPEKKLERYDKLFSQPWPGMPDDTKLIDALVNASLGKLVAE